MPSAPLTGKRRATDAEPPTTPSRSKRSTSASDKWWLKISPLQPHDDILEAVIAEWDNMKWDRLSAWVGEWCQHGLESGAVPR